MNVKLKEKIHAEILSSQVFSEIAAKLDSGWGELRAGAHEYFEGYGLPPQSDENWRRTRSSIFNFSFDSPGFSGYSIKSEQPNAKIEFFNQQKSDFFKQFWEGDLSKAYWDPISALQVAAATSFSSLVFSGQDSACELSVQVPTGAVSSSVIGIVVKKFCSAKIIERLNFDYSGLYFPRIEIRLEEGAKLEYCSLQNLPNSAQYLALKRVQLGRDSECKMFHLGLGAQTARVDLECLLAGQGSRLELGGFYLADGKRHVDFHPVQIHLSPYTSSNLYYKGVIKDKARSVYTGFIKVAPGAQKTDAYQANRNLLLSSEARADSIPNLEIKANDVKCSHGSSCTQLGEDEMFYLRSRGLSPEMAEKLLVEGYVGDLLPRLSSTALREEVNNLVLAKLAQKKA